MHNSTFMYFKEYKNELSNKKIVLNFYKWQWRMAGGGRQKIKRFSYFLTKLPQKYAIRTHKIENFLLIEYPRNFLNAY